MEYSKLLHDLSLSEEWVRSLEQRRDVAFQHQSLANELTAPATAADAYARLEQALGGNENDMLACQLLAACTTRRRYREAGIPDTVFLATMGCFPRFLGETLKRTGRHTFDRGWWSYRQLSMVLFRVGELEYELLEKERAISIHIPSDSRLEPENVDASLAAAREFLQRHFPDYSGLPFVCHSWLLCPQLGQLLPENSRILAFQRRFRILEAEPDTKDYLEWLYAASEDTPIADLPENTSLQRSVKRRLLAGGTIGVALGLME